MAERKAADASAARCGGWTEKVVYTAAEDGVALEGALLRPAPGPASPTAVVWVHGYSSVFYSRYAMRIGRALAGGGYPFVTGNTRGHDMGTRIHPTGDAPRLAGAVWEWFSESPADVAAWVDFAISAGAGGVALVGHSFGALKALHYLASRDDTRVRGLALASSPTRHHRRTHFAAPEVRALAEQLVREGRPEEVLPAALTDYPIGAQAYLDQAGMDLDLYGLDAPAGATAAVPPSFASVPRGAPSPAEPAVTRIECPILAFYGTAGDVGTAADLAMIRANARAAPRVDTHLFDGAGHTYDGHEPRVATVLAAWVASLPTARVVLSGAVR